MSGELIYKCREGCTGTFPDCVPYCETCPSNSQCIMPKFCECNRGFKPLAEKGRLQSCQPICNFDCPSHSSCIGDNICECDKNYEKDKSNIYLQLNDELCLPICNMTCPDNSHCAAPNICECSTGFEEVRPDGRKMKCQKFDYINYFMEYIIGVLVICALIVVLAAIYLTKTLLKPRKTQVNILELPFPMSTY